MVDLAGTQLQPHEKVRLLDPLVAGVILFARNYESPQQIAELCETIHNLRHPRLLIGVDHEGGRVQRFKEGFTRIPPMGLLGKLYQQAPDKALDLAEKAGWLLATELLSVGVDFSFTPVVDLDYGDSRVIGDRAFHSDPIVVGKLAFRLMKGMREAGMAAVAKHFPGHGYIQADTHVEIAVDERSFEQIRLQDLQPFLKLIENGVDAIMPAHVRYPKVDDLPAGFSATWLKQVLRQQCHFEGVIVSDDLSMHAASAYGDVTQRVAMALNAGCDLALVCNSPQEAVQVLAQLKVSANPLSHARLIRLHGHAHHHYAQLATNPLWQAASLIVNRALSQDGQQELI
ncbi:beta-hexosaminidase [Thiosulfativibrio zosterae]|uniref:Beta-hexosaminidase n=2 Tax=Thiosulfativibrio zosterae TaxID=2675053 RepID=A0A6F8PN82_9GAMM|nr:beta-hexosaminidase [Thiosulfativibrio zosterae]